MKTYKITNIITSIFRLDELNKTYRKNFYSIVADFNLMTKKGRNDFVKYFVDNSKRFKATWEFKELKDISSNIIYSL